MLGAQEEAEGRGTFAEVLAPPRPRAQRVSRRYLHRPTPEHSGFRAGTCTAPPQSTASFARVLAPHRPGLRGRAICPRRPWTLQSGVLARPNAVSPI
jgi:hypothetical protein